MSAPRKPQNLPRCPWWREQVGRWLAAAPTPRERALRTYEIERWEDHAHQAFGLRREREHDFSRRFPTRQDTGYPNFMVDEATPEFRRAYSEWCNAVDTWKSVRLREKWERNRRFAILRNTIRKRDRLAAGRLKMKGHGW